MRENVVQIKSFSHCNKYALQCFIVKKNSYSIPLAILIFVKLVTTYLCFIFLLTA